MVFLYHYCWGSCLQTTEDPFGYGPPEQSKKVKLLLPIFDNLKENENCDQSYLTKNKKKRNF